MTIKELSKFINNDRESEAFLLGIGILKQFYVCPICKSSHIGRVRRGKYKCYGCKLEWNIRKDSYLEGKKITLTNFICCLKFFADGMNATKCAMELEISSKQTRKIFNNLRELLIGKMSPIVNEKENLIFKIQEIDGVIFIQFDIKNLDAANNAYLIATRSVDGDREYCYNFEYKNLRIKSLLNEIGKIDKLDDFYRFCKERIFYFRGRDKSYLLALIQELVFRYNHRNEDLIKILIDKLNYKSRVR